MNLKQEEIARELETLLTNALRDKFKSQGHTATGKGSKSIETKVLGNGTNLVIQVLGEDYLLNQETGRKAGKLPNIDALKKWVKQKGIASESKAVNRIAWAIGVNMKKIGMHSKNSRLDMSKRRFISSTVEEEANVINDKLFQMFEKNFNVLITKYANSNKQVNQIIL